MAAEDTKWHTGYINKVAVALSHAHLWPGLEPLLWVALLLGIALLLPWLPEEPAPPSSSSVLYNQHLHIKMVPLHQGAHHGRWRRAVSSFMQE